MERKIVLAWDVTISTSDQRKVAIYAEMDYRGDSKEVYFGLEENMPTLYEISGSVIIKDNNFWDPHENAPLSADLLQQGVTMAIFGIINYSGQIEKAFPEYYESVRQEINFRDVAGRQYYYFKMLFPYVQFCRRFKWLADGITTKIAEGKKQQIYFHSTIGEVWWMEAAWHFIGLISAILVLSGLSIFLSNILVGIISILAGGVIGYMRLNFVKNKYEQLKAKWISIEQELEANYATYSAAKSHS